MAKGLRYRLGLDLGTNSLGWCVYRLNGDGEISAIVRLGSRIFSDGRDAKSLASLAATRRLARQMRRRRDRVLKRRHRILLALERFGLMPSSGDERKALQALDPFDLRRKGLDQALMPHEIGRAIYHLSKRRGFRSSRKDGGDAESDKETGKVKSAIQRLREKIAGEHCRTVGEYLAKQHDQRLPVRARRSPDGEYVLYLQRDMVAEEFDALWTAQRAHHPSLLTDQARDYLRDSLLFQRRLLPVRPGRCIFEVDEFRAPLSSPLQQRFRVLQELNNLRLIDGMEQRALTLMERNLLLDRLTREREVTFAQLRKTLGIARSSGTRFNLESERRSKLKGDLVSSQLGAAACVGPDWYAWPLARQELLANLVASSEHADELVAALVGPTWGFTGEQARAISNCRLPDDYGSLSRNALERIVPELEREVVTYDVAVVRAGYNHHSALHTGEFFKRLPYYGEVLRGYTAPADKARDPDEQRYGRIPNPTVHIGLNQVRQLLNALIKRYGHPEEIVVEMTRDFGLSGERRRELSKEQEASQRRNERLDSELERLGLRPGGQNRLKLRLWDELGTDDALDRYCVYSGQRLSKVQLFSDEIEVDHVLPFSRSLHDGIGNKVLCTRQANRDKGSRTPFEAWGHDPEKWEAITARVQRRFAASVNPSTRRKADLFREDALERFLDGKDFLDRQLTDTAYLTRAARQYLSYICHKDRVWVSSGKLTGLLRSRWGLARLLWESGGKNRNDHRHHALDAAVVGTCSRSVIQRIATAAGRSESRGEQRLLESLELPWPAFRDDLGDALTKIIVSHKPDHGREGRLHNDTNYGLRDQPDGSGNPLVGRRVPIESLKGAKDLDGVSDPVIREQLRVLLAPLTNAREIRMALASFSARTGIRRVMKQERLSVIPILDRRTQAPYRYVKGDGNHCYEIFRTPNGKWGGQVISTFSANGRGLSEAPSIASNGAPLAMRLMKNDLLACRINGERRILRVAKFSEGTIALVDHFEANVDARTRDKTSGLKYVFKSPGALPGIEARIVGVDILGYVNTRAGSP